MTRPHPTITVGGSLLDASRVALPLTIQHGRSAAATQPDAPECGFTWIGPDVPFQMGDPVVVAVELPTAGVHETWGSGVVTWTDLNYGWAGAPLSESVRFVGQISNVEAVEENGTVNEWRIGCIGTQARLGTTPVSLSRPKETDVARVQAICDAVGIPVTILGTVTNDLIADTIERDALSALHEICESTAGLLAQGRNGEMFYGTADHRSGPAEAILPASATLDGVQWATTVSGIINHVVISYGVAGSQNTYRDDASIERWGFRHAEVSTLLDKETDADVLGQTIIIRRASPYWSMPGVVVNSIDCSDAEYWQMNNIPISAGVLIPIPTQPGEVGETVGVWTVEGWVETWNTPDNQTLQIALSDRARWGAYALRKWSAVAEQPWSYWVPFTWLQQLTA